MKNEVQIFNVMLDTNGEYPRWIKFKYKKPINNKLTQ